MAPPILALFPKKVLLLKSNEYGMCGILALDKYKAPPTPLVHIFPLNVVLDIFK